MCTNAKSAVLPLLSISARALAAVKSTCDASRDESILSSHLPATRASMQGTETIPGPRAVAGGLPIANHTHAEYNKSTINTVDCQHHSS